MVALIGIIDIGRREEVDEIPYIFLIVRNGLSGQNCDANRQAQVKLQFFMVIAEFDGRLFQLICS